MKTTPREGHALACIKLLLQCLLVKSGIHIVLLFFESLCNIDCLLKQVLKIHNTIYYVFCTANTN